MSTWGRFATYQMQSVQRSCNEAVREALSCGMTSTELRAVMADAWREELTDRAISGQRELAGA